MDQYEKAKDYITQCFQLAQNGRGKVSPNPYVGAIIVKEGRIIGEGWHDYFGGPHAEVMALKNTKESVEGATIYVNLEPCCHENKKTPPCVDLIIKKKIARVVCSNIDPNRLVNGKGIEKLRNAGIKVVTGVLENQGKNLNKVFFKFIQNKIPYVILKVAQTIDGKISLAQGKQTWITEEKSIEFVHKYRAIYDSVLVGANTIIVDNPLLNIRKVSGRDPFRIIIDGDLRTPTDANVYSDGMQNRTMVFTICKSNMSKIRKLKQKGIKVIEMVATDTKRLDLEIILKYLGKKNISSVLVEGGNQMFSQFVEANLFDEIVIIQAPKLFGAGINGFTLSSPIEVELSSVTKLENDIILKFNKQKT